MSIAEEGQAAQARLADRQQQRICNRAPARHPAGARGIPDSRPHRRATHSAPRLSRGAATFRSHRQHADRIQTANVRQSATAICEEVAMALDLTQHPCFNSDVRHRTGRIHLPVAPKCNIQCNYCNRKFDCANESRPGVTSAVLSPNQALALSHRALEKAPYLKVVGIAGPGDPFANPEETHGNPAPGSREVSGDAAVRRDQWAECWNPMSRNWRSCRSAMSPSPSTPSIRRLERNLRLGARRAHDLSRRSRRASCCWERQKTCDRGA